jgi:ABC-type uncharacterized transport system substrate-binding protein
LIKVDAVLLFSAEGQVIGVSEHWETDPQYSVDALEGLDANGDGSYDATELAVLAKENAEGLVEVGFYTEVVVNGKPIDVKAPTDMVVERDTKAILHLKFTLPFAMAIAPADGGLSFRVYDPEYFVDFQFAEENPVRLGPGASPNCKVRSKAGTGDIDSAGSWGGAYAVTQELHCDAN